MSGLEGLTKWQQVDVAWIKMACDAAQGRAVVHTVPLNAGHRKSR